MSHMSHMIWVISYELSIYLETSWAPVNKLNGSLGFDVGNGSINILWNDVTTEEEAASHVFTLILGKVRVCVAYRVGFCLCLVW